MDTLAHGLWGGAAFGQKQPGQWKWAFWLGMAPDLFSFGPFFLTQLGTIVERWTAGQRMEPPDPSIIPAYVYHAYNVTHSLVVWIVILAIVWIVSAGRRNGGSVEQRRTAEPPIRAVWPFGAWALHILCDIPTHSTRFFPTPFLWPFDTPLVNGRPWSRPPFPLINYALMSLAYLGIYFYKKRAKT